MIRIFSCASLCLVLLSSSLWGAGPYKDHYHFARGFNQAVLWYSPKVESMVEFDKVQNSGFFLGFANAEVVGPAPEHAQNRSATYSWTPGGKGEVGVVAASNGVTSKGTNAINSLSKYSASIRGEHMAARDENNSSITASLACTVPGNSIGGSSFSVRLGINSFTTGIRASWDASNSEWDRFEWKLGANGYAWFYVDSVPSLWWVDITFPTGPIDRDLDKAMIDASGFVTAIGDGVKSTTGRYFECRGTAE